MSNCNNTFIFYLESIWFKCKLLTESLIWIRPNDIMPQLKPHTPTKKFHMFTVFCKWTQFVQVFVTHSFILNVTCCHHLFMGWYVVYLLLWLLHRKTNSLWIVFEVHHYINPLAVFVKCHFCILFGIPICPKLKMFENLFTVYFTFRLH